MKKFILILVILSMFLVSGCQIGDYKISKVSEDNPLTDRNEEKTLIDLCKDDLEYWADISKQKYGTSYSILKTGEFEDINSAKDFADIWSNALWKNPDLYNQDFDFPIVLIAIKFKGPGGELPIVLTCNKDGNLMTFSKKSILI
jgi:hypothetical protein